MKQSTPSDQKSAFTLIELLIVVAIIAILAAIAVPNFLEAQMRAKIASAKSNMRTLVTGIESYRVDYSAYPFDHGWGAYYEDWKQLTTPVAYLSTVPLDPFPIDVVPPILTQWVKPGQSIPFDYGGPNPAWPANLLELYQKRGVYYYFFSPGPDKIYDTWFTYNNGSWGYTSDGHDRVSSLPAPYGKKYLYDPTNGTTSAGDLVATSKGGLQNQ